MSSYNAKNYTEMGGEVTHIGGKLIFDEGAVVKDCPCGCCDDDSGFEIPVASETRLGCVKIGDGLSIDDGGVLSANMRTLPDATVETRGVVKSAESQDAINTTDLSVFVQAFNSLLEKLKNAGLMASNVAPAGV